MEDTTDTITTDTMDTTSRKDSSALSYK